jgi:hypothetical protein
VLRCVIQLDEFTVTDATEPDTVALTPPPTWVGVGNLLDAVEPGHTDGLTCRGSGPGDNIDTVVESETDHPGLAVSEQVERGVGERRQGAPVGRAVDPVVGVGEYRSELDAVEVLVQWLFGEIVTDHVERDVPTT